MSTSSKETIDLAVGAEKSSEVERHPKASDRSQEEDVQPQEKDQNPNPSDEETSFCRVCTSYSSELLTELQLEEGDIVEVLSKRPDGWWTGILRGKVGLFPSIFVVPITADQVPRDDNLKYCKVLFDCTPEMADELKLRENDVIEVISKYSDGWWKGRLGDQVGMFPSNFVTMISTPTAPPSISTTSTSSCSAEAVQTGTEVILTQCQVVVPFPGNDDDELTLEDGDIITLVSKDVKDDGLWWKGVLRGRTGVFPRYFVKELTTSATENDESQSTDVPVVIEESNEVEQNLQESLEKSLLSPNSCNVPEPVALPVSTDNAETAALPQCRVVAPYFGTENDELSLAEGDLITIISKEGHWWKGTLKGKTGLFPKSFVEELSTSTEEEQRAGFSEESLKRLLEQEIMEKLRIENEDKKKCVICMDCDINSAFFPCGHITCCADCAPKNDICPLCRMTIEKTERIYLPG